jgi:hypothetical protein
MGIIKSILVTLSIILLTSVELMAAPKGSKSTARVCYNTSSGTKTPAEDSQSKEIKGWRTAAKKRGMSSNGYLALIMTSTQRMIVLPPDGKPISYVISTSKFGVGNVENSNKTPLGWHRVNERIGHGRPVGAVFSSRAFTGKVIPRAQLTRAASEDMVLTRIMWLEGLEPGKNSGKGIDSHDRCIYIHGTNQEQLLGQPASHGCIRMSNDDVIELFELTMNNDFYCVIL